MPHNPTSPTADARQAAASELRAHAEALRELAAAAAGNAAKEATSLEHTSDQAIEWARTRADELDQVATWLAEPFGRCDECNTVLQHFDTGRVGGVLCPLCDGDYVEQLTTCPHCGSDELDEHGACAACTGRDRVAPDADPYKLERDRTPRHKLPRAQRACPVCKAPGVIDAGHLRQLQATCTECGWHYSERYRCAVCSHEELAHEQTGKVECECCHRGVFHRTDPEGPAFAAAIAQGLRGRLEGMARKVALSEKLHEAAAKGPASALVAAAAMAPARCAECGEKLRGVIGSVCNACKDLQP